MERKAMQALSSWKVSRRRKPLILRGARQTGKTWLMREFGRTQFAKTAYISFDNNPVMSAVFNEDFNISRILMAIGIETGQKVTAGDTLVVLDEIQECPKAITALKYFCEQAPGFHVVAAGSLLGVALHRGVSFPVGKVDSLDIYPMTFREFLRALGKDELAEVITTLDEQLLRSFRPLFADLLKKYCFVGGMPEAVACFAQESDLHEVRQIQNGIVTMYEQDFGKHTPVEMILRLRMAWNSIPVQLARENKKFMYGAVKQGSRAKEFELALAWLADCGLVHRVSRVSKPAIPLKAYSDLGAFKLFLSDVGLLGALSGIEARTILEGNRLFTEFKGAMAEQYVLQQIVSDTEYIPYYYVNPSTQTEIDFIIQKDDGVVPIEVKAGENLTGKSLKAFCQKFSPDMAVRTSMADYIRQDWLTSLPLWAIAAL